MRKLLTTSSTFIFCLLNFCSCDNRNSNHLPASQRTNVIINVLRGQDSAIMNERYSSARKIDTSILNTGCLTILNYYDDSVNLIIRESLQTCQSDIKQVIGHRIYYDKKKKEILRYSFNGMGQIIAVERNY